MAHFGVRIRGYARHQVDALAERVEQSLAGTGEITARDLRKVLDEGAFDVVLRGYDMHEVQAALQEWLRELDGHQQADAVQEATDRETRLLDPKVRSSATLLTQILDPGFTEIGSAGQLRDRAAIIKALPGESGPSDEPISVRELSGRLIAPGIVHLTYIAEQPGRRTRRSSLWRRSGKNWRLYFQQETLISD